MRPMIQLKQVYHRTLLRKPTFYTYFIEFTKLHFSHPIFDKNMKKQYQWKMQIQSLKAKMQFKKKDVNVLLKLIAPIQFWNAYL